MPSERADSRSPLSPDARRGLIAVGIGAFCFRFWRAWDEAPFFDDFFNIYNATRTRSFAEFWESIAHNPHHGLVIPVVNAVAARVTDALFVQRFPNILIGMFGALAAFPMGRRLGGARLGLVASGLMACATLHIEASRALEYYPLLAFLTIVSVVALWRAVDSARAVDWLIYSGVLALFSLTHPHALLVAGVEGVWVFVFRRKSLRRFSATVVVPVAISIAWAGLLLWPFVRSDAYRIANVAEWSVWWYDLERVALTWGGAAFEAYDRNPNLTGWAARYALVAANFTAFVIGLTVLVRSRKLQPEWWLVVWLIPSALLGAWLSDRFVGHGFAPRHTLFAVPFFLLIAAHGACTAWNRIESRVEGADYVWWLFSSVYIGIAVAVVGMDVRRGCETWGRYQAAADRFAATASANKVLVFDNANSAVHFLYYYDRGAFRKALPPRLYDGFYQFRIPDGLTAERDGRASRIFAVDDPALNLTQETERWRAAKLSADSVVFAGEGHPMPTSNKIPEFMKLLGYQPSR